MSNVQGLPPKLKSGESRFVVLFNEGWEFHSTLAEILVDRGYDVISCGKGEIAQHGIVYDTLDTANEASVKEFVEFVKTTVGDKGCDLIILQGLIWFVPVMDVTDQQVKDSLAYNVYGNYTLIKHLLPEIIKGKTDESRGKILVLQSMLESYISPYNGFYGVTRHALRGLFAILDLELKNSQIPVRVTKIIPGIMDVSLFWEMKQAKLDWLKLNNSLFTKAMAVDTHYDNTEARMKAAASVEFISKHFYQCLEQDQPKPKVWGGNPILGFIFKTMMRTYKPSYWKKPNYLETDIETADGS